VQRKYHIPRENADLGQRLVQRETRPLHDREGTETNANSFESEPVNHQRAEQGL